MIGIGRALIILQVASDTGAAVQVVISVDVALRARQRAMRARQSEACELEMIEADSEPSVHSVALLASGRKFGAYVVRDGSLLVILGMT